jgi:hypothetical protein
VVAAFPSGAVARDRRLPHVWIVGRGRAHLPRAALDRLPGPAGTRSAHAGTCRRQRRCARDFRGPPGHARTRGKISSPPFLDAVAQILKRNPQCGYIWTGPRCIRGIASFFQRHGLASRCHFVGWVDTPLYAAILDLFLETFPLGCSITGYRRWARACRSSFLDSNGLPACSTGAASLARGRGRSVDASQCSAVPGALRAGRKDYVELATRAINDRLPRIVARARGALLRREIGASRATRKRFFAAIGESPGERPRSHATHPSSSSAPAATLWASSTPSKR